MTAPSKHAGGRPRKYASRADFEKHARGPVRMALRLKHDLPPKVALAYALDIDEDTLARTLARFGITEGVLQELAKDRDPSDEV